MIVDDEASTPPARRFKMAPPVDPKFGRSMQPVKDDASLRDFAMMNGARESHRSPRDGDGNGSIRSFNVPSARSGSPYTLRID